MNIENFCALWSKSHISEYFCEGCEYLNNLGNCNYCSIEEKQEVYSLLERLQTGL